MRHFWILGKGFSINLETGDGFAMRLVPWKPYFFSENRSKERINGILVSQVHLFIKSMQNRQKQANRVHSQIKQQTKEQTKTRKTIQRLFFSRVLHDVLIYAISFPLTSPFLFTYPLQFKDKLVDRFAFVVTVWVNWLSTFATTPGWSSSEQHVPGSEVMDEHVETKW